MSGVIRQSLTGASPTVPSSSAVFFCLSMNMLRPLFLSLLTLYGTLLPLAIAYSIPQNGTSAQRQQAIDATREEFLYGPAVAGGPFYPAGPKGNAKAAADIADVQREITPNSALVQLELARAGNSSEQVNYDRICLLRHR
jgi:hypothetical protein